MLKTRFLEIEKTLDGTIEYDVSRAKYAYYRIGGNAAIIATPRSLAALKTFHEVIFETRCPYFILGWGSNLLFSDEAFPGVVIRMKHLFTDAEALTELNGQKGTFLKLGASLGASLLLKKACEQGYGGLTCLTGIPGSIGGMVAMNAGTSIGEIGSLLIQTETVNLNEADFKTKTHLHVASDFSYRHNHFLKPGDLITHTYLRYVPEETSLVKTKIDDLYARRKNTQPVNFPSCGSVFMNPAKNLQAWQVIDRLGLRGHKLGGAQISEKHPNFIINLGSAKSSEVKELITLIKTRAKAELDVELKEEVKFIP
jgi:UDP-N-acetylmuramate dehydrogenase